MLPVSPSLLAKRSLRSKFPRVLMGSISERNTDSCLPTAVANNLSTPPNRWAFLIWHRFHLSFPGFGSSEGSERSQLSHQIPQR